jgi:hypothetical protein
MGRIKDSLASAALVGVGFTIVVASFKNPLGPLIGLGVIMGLIGLFCLMAVVDGKYK